MTSPISAVSIPAVAALQQLTPVGAPVATQPSTTVGPTTATGNDFGSILAQQIDNVQGLQSKADVLAQQAATGDLTDPAQYMVAASEASLATDTVVAIKNQAVAAFNQIMGMSV